MLLHLAKDILEIGRQTAPHFGDNPSRNELVVSLSDAARNAGQSVAIAAQRDGKADGAFKIAASEESDDGFGHRALARFFKLITRTDLVASAV